MLSVIRTCHTLNALGAIRLLEFPISLRFTEEPYYRSRWECLAEEEQEIRVVERRHIATFCAFVLAQARRPQHLRHLTIEGYSEEDETAIPGFSSLVTVLVQASNLETFAFQGPHGSLLLSGLAHITSIRTLELHDLLTSNIEILERWRSPIVSSMVRWDKKSMPIDAEPRAWLAPSAPFSNTLREFRGSFHPEAYKISDPVPSVTFPLVEGFTMLPMENVVLPTPMFCRAFPALRNLDLGRSLEDLEDEDYEEQLDAMNALNDTEELSWPELDYVQGAVNQLYASAFRVGNVHKMQLIALGMPHCIQQAAVVFTNMPPEELNLFVVQESYAVSELEGLLSLAAESADSIGEFDLIYYIAEEREPICDELVSQLAASSGGIADEGGCPQATMISALQVLDTVVKINIRISYDALWWRQDEWEDLPRELHEILDLEELKRNILEFELPCLRELSLYIGSPGWERAVWVAEPEE